MKRYLWFITLALLLVVGSALVQREPEMFLEDTTINVSTTEIKTLAAYQPQREIILLSAAQEEVQTIYAPTPTPMPEPTPAIRFVLTEAERDMIEWVVMAESEGEPYIGQVAVAQCILTACEEDDISPEEAVIKYRYSMTRTEPSESVKEAVAAVFDNGETVTDRPIKYFYAPASTTSWWHETQIFVIEISRHRFFEEKKN